MHDLILQLHSLFISFFQKKLFPFAKPGFIMNSDRDKEVEVIDPFPIAVNSEGEIRR
jgi:hypothetical protein